MEANNHRGWREVGRAILEGFRSVVLIPSQSQQRRVTRLNCSYPVSCEHHRESFEASVVDMSTSGLRLVVPDRLPPGDLVAVTYKRPKGERPYEFDMIWGRVMWCRKKRGSHDIEAGLVYDDQPNVMEGSWAYYFLGQVGFEVPRPADRRDNLRFSASLRANVKTADGDQARGSVLNLGVGGLLLETETKLPLEMAVDVEVEPYAPLDPLLCLGRVKSVSLFRKTSRWRTGIQFENVTPAQMSLLSNYIHNLFRDALGGYESM